MSRLCYLNLDLMDALDARTFQHAHPYPWIDPGDFITADGYARLVASLPAVDLFTTHFGHQRKYGQQAHDRYALSYHPQLPVGQPWHDFVGELLGDDYQRFIERVCGARNFRMLMHWHYTPRGCQVSPHCDAKRKIGSHIFYFNTAGDWQEDWGGQTRVLDDGGRFASDTAPDFDDFIESGASRALGNHSFLFMRRGNSWHGVRPLTCPEDTLRKVFIIVFEDWRLRWRIASFVRRDGQHGFRPRRRPPVPA